MRVFIAIDLPEEIRKGLGELQRALRPVTGTARWVPPDAIHITLKFIGEVAETRIRDIDSALAGLSWKPIMVTVRGVGFFPGNRSPRVFWAGLMAPMMPGFAEKLDARLEQLGFDKDKRAFRPHITLARARENRMDNSLVAAAQSYEQHEFGSFSADRFFLFQSELKPTGAVYTKLKEYCLERQ
jgi:2'-5' RNA ligase